MIQPRFINEWRQIAPWSDDTMVEQDLLISRLLVELFQLPEISNGFAFRGGTAIYKLFSNEPIRYSEDIDLVQINAEPIGKSIGVIRSLIDPILGKPRRGSSKKGFTLIYGFYPEGVSEKQSLKIEINTREHFSVFGLERKEFNIQSQWFSGTTDIQSYNFDELIGTKLRAFYERDKGRDLFDLWFALQQPNFNPKKAVQAFLQYIKQEGKNITRAMYEMNFAEKNESGSFSEDISPLLAPTVNWNYEQAAIDVFETFTSLLPGEKWKGA